MENSNSLIRKARALESAGQDQGALDCYLQALAAPGAEPNANLHARAGVLQLRLGHLAEAADTLARASDFYAGAGLRNNALAICHRLLRVDAARPEFLRRLGDLSALQGFRADARRGYLDLASAVEGHDPDAAGSALRDYLARFPDDAEAARRLLDLTGEPAPAAATPLAEARAPEQYGVLGDLIAGTAAPVDGTVDPDFLPLDGLEPTHAGDSWSSPAGPPDELGLIRHADEPEHVAPVREEAKPAPESARQSIVAGPSTGLEPLCEAERSPRAEPDEEVEEALEEEVEEALEEEPLPLLGVEPQAWTEPCRREDAEPVADAVSTLRDRLARDPDDLEAHAALVEHLESGDDASLGDALAAAHPAFARAGQHGDAAGLAERLSRLRPGDAIALQAWAEHAFRSGDRPRLVTAYLAVARRFAEAGEREPARRVFERILKLDPTNAAAREGVGVVDPPAGDFVDFGALVREEASTRFQMEASLPSGDEEEDFQEILAAFRQQITAGIDAEDSASHYDLAIAFKEMGLWDDAVTQLQRALRAGSSPLATMELLGECYHQKGEYDLAARVLHGAEALPGRSAGELAGVRYWLARSHEALGTLAPARASYRLVSAVDSGFRDVASRLNALGPG